MKKMNRSCGTAENQGTSWSAWFHRAGLQQRTFAEAGDAEEGPTTLGCSKVRRLWPLRERGRCIVLRSPRFTTFEPPEAASCAFQYRTAWRMRQVPKLFPYGRRYGRDLR